MAARALLIRISKNVKGILKSGMTSRTVVETVEDHSLLVDEINVQSGFESRASSPNDKAIPCPYCSSFLHVKFFSAEMEDKVSVFKLVRVTQLIFFLLWQPWLLY